MSEPPAAEDIHVYLLTISDSRSEADDESGRTMKQRVEQSPFQLAGHRIVREDKESLERAFRQALDRESVQVVISSGGTGISRRDRTLEVVRPLLDKELPGFGELFRHLSYEEIGAFTVMSRATAGRSRDKLILALPGSPSAVALAFDDIILDVLGHMVREVLK